MREMCRRTVFISWMSAPHLSSPRVSAVLASSEMPCTGAAHSEEAPPENSTSTRSLAVARAASDSVRSAAATLAASGVGWRACTRPMTCAPSPRGSLVPCGAVVKPVTRSSTPSPAVVIFGRGGHGGSRLAGADHDDATLVGRSRQVRRQAHVGMRGGDGRLVKRQQPGARRRSRYIACHGARFFPSCPRRRMCRAGRQPSSGGVTGPGPHTATPARLVTPGSAHYIRPHG